MKPRTNPNQKSSNIHIVCLHSVFHFSKTQHRKFSIISETRKINKNQNQRKWQIVIHICKFTKQKKIVVIQGCRVSRLSLSLDTSWDRFFYVSVSFFILESSIYVTISVLKSSLGVPKTFMKQVCFCLEHVVSRSITESD